MVGVVFFVAIGVALLIVAVLIYVLGVVLGRRVGTKGIVQRSHLRCPKCEQEFDYDWIPGASFTAVRLGPARYMACPLCHRWSTFDLYGHLVARTPVTSYDAPLPARPPAPPQP